MMISSNLKEVWDMTRLVLDFNKIATWVLTTLVALALWWLIIIAAKSIWKLCVDEFLENMINR